MLSVITVNNAFQTDSREILFRVSRTAPGIAFIWCQVTQLAPLKGACWVQGYCSMPKPHANRASPGWLLTLQQQACCAHPQDEKARTEEASEEEETTP